MKLTLHQLRKDCVRLRLPIGLWLLLVLLQAVLIMPGLAEPGEDLALQIIYKVLTNLIPLLQTILPLVIVPLLIHEEPLVGTTAFWFTRPIDGRMLLASKMLFLTLILILLPFLTELTILGVHGASANELFLAVPEILLGHLKFLTYVVVIAALTQTFARFALLGSSLFIGYYLFWFIVMVALWYVDIPSFLQGWEMPGVDVKDSQYVVSTLALIAISGMLLVNLFRKRETRRAWFAAGMALAYSFLLGLFWSWDFLAHEDIKQKLNIDTAAVVVDISTDPQSRRVSDSLRYRPKDNPEKWISAPLHISGLPARHIAEPTEIRASLKLPDGKIVKHTGHMFGNFDRNWSPNVVQEALGTAKILNPEKEKATMSKVLSIDDKTFEKYASVPGRLSAEVDFVLKRYEAVADMPVRSKARYDRGSEHAVITHVLKQTGGITVLLRESKISLFFSAEWNELHPYLDWFRRPTIYILRNNKRNEALWPDEGPGFGFEFMDLLYQKRLRTIPLALRYTALTEQGSKLTNFNDAWLADAKLVRIEAKEVARFTKTVQVDGFAMGAQ